MMTLFLSMRFIIGLMMLLGYSSISSSDHHEIENHRSLLTFTPTLDVGHPTFLDKKMFYAALVMTWNGYDAITTSDILGTLPANQSFIYQQRQQMKYSLQPTPMKTWPYIVTKPCPHYSSQASVSNNHRIERGQGMSHYQLWLDFIFFDQDVREARYRKVPEYLTSTSYSSVSGIFTAYPNGTLYKNHHPYLEEDILLVVEDGVSWLPGVSLSNLSHALSSSEHDLRILGHCSTIADTFSPVDLKQSLCPFAYAITRRGARILSQYYDVCGKRWDQQLLLLAQEEMIKMKQLKEPLFTMSDPHSVSVKS